MKKLAYLAIVFLVAVSLVGAFSGGFLYSTYIHQDKKSFDSNDFTLLKEAIDNINKVYYDKTTDKQLQNGALNGIMESLKNPYASYYEPKDYQHFQMSLDGNYSGIGVVLGGKRGQVKILKIFDKSPAQKNKIKVGDLITQINDKSAAKLGVDQAIDLIKGPAGTRVRLTIKSGRNIRKVNIIREKISFPNIVSKTYGDTGYISMHFFSEGVAEDLRDEIIKLKKKKIKSLIFDLRSNPGGRLNEAIDIASLFINNGTVVKTKNRQKQETVYSATGNQVYEGPLIVLINENSASASEIVSGAIQDRHRGKLIGVTSFGKGTVQQIVRLSNNGALVIPSEKWLTPGGRDITKKGIKPDYVLKADPHTDNQLEKAKALLK